MSQRPRATIIRLVVACAPIECIYTYIIRVYIGSSRCNPLQLTEGLYYSRRWKCGKSRSKSSSLLFLFVFFLYIYFFFIYVRRIEIEFVSCKQPYSDVNAFVTSRLPVFGSPVHNFFLTRSITVALFLFFIFIYTLSFYLHFRYIYIYIYISSPHTYYCKRTCVIFIHNMLVCVNIILI